MRAEVAALELRRLSWRRAAQGVAAIASQFAEHDLLTYSSAIAFRVLYAVLPLCFLALAALRLFGAQSVYTVHVAPTLAHRLSGDAYALVNSTALNVLSGGGRGYWLTSGLAITVWGVSAAVRATMTPFNAIYGARETRSLRHRLVLSVGVALIVIVCVFGALALVFAGRLAHPSAWGLGIALVVVRWGLTVALLLVAVASVISFVPAERQPLRWASIGSCLAAACWILATLGYAAYVGSVSYGSAYGALASVVVLLIYLHIAAIALLLGVVADAELRDLVGRR